MAKKKSNCKKCLPDWLAQFGDLMSLLLVFFILLLSMSVLDEKKVIEYLAHMKQSLGVMNNSSLSQVTLLKEIEKTIEMEKTSDNTQQTMQELTETVIVLNQRNKFNKESENEDMDIEDFAILELGKKGFIISLPSKIMFDEGKYEINNKEINIFLSSLMKILKNKPDDIILEVSGFSSDEEKSHLNTLIHPKNLWELGFFRAESIALKMINKGFDKDKIKITSFGNNKVIDYSDTRKNRRVEINIISKEFESELNSNKKDFFNKVLNQ